MTEDREEVVGKIRVTDKRKSVGPKGPADDVAEGEVVDEGTPRSADEVEKVMLERFARLQADFDNYRKRMMREQAEIAKRAQGGLLESLLPVLDNFERAIQHEEDGSHLGILQRELMAVLKEAGVTPMDAAGSEFDPTLHEAVESHEDAAVEVPTVVGVHRTGYTFGDRVLRPAAVVVARPVESAAEAEA